MAEGGEVPQGKRPLRRAKYAKVHDLNPNEHGYNLVVIVKDIEIVKDKVRADDTRVKIAEVLVGDETGCVIFKAKNEQLDLLEVGQPVVLRNCKIEMFRNFMRVAVDQWGKLSKYPDGVESTPPPPTHVEMSKNFSKLEWEAEKSYP